MPIYEYQCTSCHHKFDMLQKISEDPIKKCPKCSKNKVIRLVSAAGFQLKGSGWYVTDFKNKKESAPTKESTNSEPKTSEKTTSESAVNPPPTTTKTGDTD